MKKVLTIAGSDCSGGAGIQADIKTITVHGMYAMSAVTALVAENTKVVDSIFESPPEFLARQIDCVFTDIRPDAVKVGMVASKSLIEVIADKLIEYGADNIVVDPVMVATNGGSLIKDTAEEALITRLLPLADVITPNLSEGEALAQMSIENTAQMEEAAVRIAERIRAIKADAADDARESPAVFLKGGHLEDSADDLLFIPAEDRMVWLRGDKIDNPNTHGTGCTLSSAIACGLAAGHDVEESVRQAKGYIIDALNAGLDLGMGSGPLNHMCRKTISEEL